MTVRKLSSTDAFVVLDVPDTPSSGVVRRARKVLESSATDLARSATYSFAAFGVQRGGASAGINAEGDAVATAVAAFSAELLADVAAGHLHLVPGKGVTAAELAELSQASPFGSGPGSGSGAQPGADLGSAGIVAAAAWALGGDLAGRTVAIEGAADAPAGLAERLTQAGATVVDVWGVEEKPWLVWGAKVDVVLAGSRPGVLTEQGVAQLSARAIVPWGPLPFTTKALAHSLRGGAQLLPDFVTTAGSWLGDFLEGDGLAGDPAAVQSQVMDRITEVLTRSAAHPDGVFLGACHQAESFLATWQERLPFGRPLAA